MNDDNLIEKTVIHAMSRNRSGGKVVQKGYKLYRVLSGRLHYADYREKAKEVLERHKTALGCSK